MGLNDDVDDDLPPGVEDTEINSEQPIPDKTTFITDFTNVAKQSDPTNEELFGKGVVENELPNINAEFVLVKESFNKLEDLIILRQGLVSAKGICKEDAEIIDNNLPGFINEKKPLGFFTEEKTRTQLVETLNTLDKAIDVKISELATKASELIDTCHKKYSLELRDLQVKIISSLSTIQEEFSSFISNMDSLDSKSSIELKQFLDHRVNYYHEHNGENCHEGLELNQGFVAAIEKLKTFILISRNHSNVKALLSHINDEEDLLFTINNKDRYVVVTKEYPFFSPIEDGDLYKDRLSSNPTFYELVCNGTNGNAVSYMTNLSITVVNLIANLSKRKELIETLISSESENLNAKLEALFKLHSGNSIDVINCFYMLSFINDYCIFIKNVSEVIKTLYVVKETT